MSSSTESGETSGKTTSGKPALRDLLLLLRAPLALTAVADSVSGYFLGTLRLAASAEPGSYPGQTPSEPAEASAVALLALASASLYWAGMAWNDFFDRERDRKLYPFRPIPSGRVSAGLALAIGLALIVLGALAAFFAGGAASALRAGLVAACVLAYDGFLKRWRMSGAFGMGACRATNVLLGASVALARGLGPEGATTLPLVHAIAIGTYVFALTLLSTFEDEDATRGELAIGFGGALLIPVVLVAFYARLSRLGGTPFFGAHVALVLVLAFSAARRGTKATGRATTRWLLRGLLLLDAGALAANGFVVPALAVLALFLPLAVGAALLFRPPKPRAADVRQ